MGKILISDDHKLKLEKVLSSKSGDEITSPPVGPAPKWKIENLEKQNYELIKNDYKHNDYKNNDINGTVKHDEKKNIFLENINYLKFSKIVFLTSVIGGIGLTLGIKIGRIIFY